MNCHYSDVLLEMATTADLVSMDPGCGGHLLYTYMKLVRTSAERSKGETCLTRGCYPPLDLGVQFGALKEYFLVQRVWKIYGAYCHICILGI